MDITPYLKLMVEKEASDIFITVDSPVKIKIEGKAQPVGKTALSRLAPGAKVNLEVDLIARYVERMLAT